MNTAPETLPAWFDAMLHFHSPTGGVYERGTGVLLGELGEAASAVVRALRAEAAAVPAEKGPARKPRRGTIKILTDHQAQSAAAAAPEAVATPVLEANATPVLEANATAVAEQE
jgi:hypothetical protein